MSRRAAFGLSWERGIELNNVFYPVGLSVMPAGRSFPAPPIAPRMRLLLCYSNLLGSRQAYSDPVQEGLPRPLLDSNPWWALAACLLPTSPRLFD